MTAPILVGVDPRRHDPEPLALASLIAGLTGARVIALCSYAHNRLRHEGAELERVLHDAAIDALERSTSELPSGATTEAVPSESPARALHEAAESTAAGLLVVGSAHGGPRGRLVPGSVADRILHGAPCPVAIAPRGYAPPSGGVRNVGAAFVDTPEGRDALAAAGALAVRAGARLEAITVVDWFDPIGRVEPPPELIEHEQAQARELAHAAARHALERRAATIDAEAVVLPGRPAATLVERSQGLDLLVVGSRGYGPMKAVLLGSVSRALAHHGRCPLIVVPRGSEGALTALVAGGVDQAGDTTT